MAIELQSSQGSFERVIVDPTSYALRSALYNKNGKNVSPLGERTYFAAGTFTPPATPSDMVAIFGASSLKIRVLSMRIGTVNTAAGSQIFHLIKRITANSGGTFIAATPVAAQGSDIAASATVGHYTANPTPGTSGGTVNIKKVASPVATPASFAGIVTEAEYEMIPKFDFPFAKPITLEGTSEGLVINFNGLALVAGQIHHYGIVWTEESD